jgi:hypothetical protein
MRRLRILWGSVDSRIGYDRVNLRGLNLVKRK